MNLMSICFTMLRDKLSLVVFNIDHQCTSAIQPGPAVYLLPPTTRIIFITSICTKVFTCLLYALHQVSSITLSDCVCKKANHTSTSQILTSIFSDLYIASIVHRKVEEGLVCTGFPLIHFPSP